MPTLKEVEYLTNTGYVPTPQLNIKDPRVGFSVLNYTPYTVSLIVDDSLSYSFKIIPFAAKSVSIDIHRHVKVEFPIDAKLAEEDFVEVGLYAESEVSAVSKAIGEDLVGKYIRLLKKYNEEAF